MVTLRKLSETSSLTFYTSAFIPSEGLPLFNSPVSAGFPSPAEDYVELKLDLNEHLIQHPIATFFVKVSGNSMTGAGIKDGDLLVIDRALTAKNNDIVIGVINGEFTVKRIRTVKGVMFLVPENPNYKPIEITQEMDFQVWGVVSYVIHKPN